MKPRVLARRIGVPGFTAVLVVAWAAWTHWVIEPGLTADIASLRGQLHEAKVRAAAPPLASASTAEVLLRDFHARLPDDAASNDTLAAVLKQAETTGLSVETARFETEATRLPGVVRHRADLPLKGRYAALRAWLSRALRDNGGLTLDALDIERHDVDSNDVEAKVTLSLWARATALDGAFDTRGGHGR
jgi:hypothetical protein